MPASTQARCFSKAEVAIGPEETAIELSTRLAEAGADLLIETLSHLDSIAPEDQDNAAATYAPILNKEDGLIDWQLSAQSIHDRIRGFQPWPGAYTSFRGHKLHVWSSSVTDHSSPYPPGVLKLDDHRLYASAGDGLFLELREVQLEGRKRLPGRCILERRAPCPSRNFGRIEDLNLPVGYRYAATYAGIRAVAKDDLALIVSALPANAAAVFTQNRIQAAPVRLSRQNLRASKGKAGAILINAGNANCATRTGDRVALATCRAVAKLLRLQSSQVLCASTGVIGVELDPEKIIGALPSLTSSLAVDAFERVSRAIMTTDKVPKTAYEEITLRRGTVRIAGMTKGAGMIQPRMATTLGFVLTDAAIPIAVLRRMLVAGNELSYSRISIDGDTSTNDTLMLLANGASGVRPDPERVPSRCRGRNPRHAISGPTNRSRW